MLLDTVEDQLLVKIEFLNMMVKILLFVIMTIKITPIMKGLLLLMNLWLYYLDI